MGKREPKHLFEDNPFLDGFAEWMGSAEGQLSGEALDVIWVLLETAHVDAKKRKIIWEDGQRLSITESVQRIHADHPDFPPELIEEHLIGWLQMEQASWKAFHDAFYGKSNVMEGKLLVGGGNRLVAEAFLIEKALIFFP